MPELLMRQRGHFVGEKGESLTEHDTRFSEWNDNQALIAEWQRLFRSLGDDRAHFIAAIADNIFLPEKLLGLANPLWQKLYYFYLTCNRRFRLMEILDMDSPTARNLYNYIKHDFPLLYRETIKAMTENVIQQSFQIKAYTKFFGREGIIDLLSELGKKDYEQDTLLLTWSKANIAGSVECDYSLIRLYRRFVKLACLDADTHRVAQSAILNLDMDQLRQLLTENFVDFKRAVMDSTEAEHGQMFLYSIKEQLLKQIQISFLDGGDYNI